jgi:hypothetical protein
MEDISKVIISTTSGYCCIDEAYVDRIVITDHSIHYEFKPELLAKMSPISWTAKTRDPAYIGLYHKLAEVVLSKLEAPMPIQYCDVGDITLSVVFSDKKRKTQSFLVSPEDLEPCFSIMKQMVRMVTKAPDGMLYEYEDE